MSKSITIIGIAVLFLSLIFLRGFYRDFLYDPFIEFFSKDYLNSEFPKIDELYYFLTICIRFFINTGISLAIIFLFFSKKAFVLMALKIYIVVFVILNILFFLELKFNFSNTYLLLFYVRRFLIHPLLLLVLLPAFYYQQLSKKDE